MVFIAEAPASAEKAGARLAVSATVLPSCEIEASEEGAASSCTAGTRPRVTVEREQPPIASDTETAPDAGDSLTVVTVTY